MVHSRVHTESLISSVFGGWHLIQRDPVRILLPAAGTLALHSLAIGAVIQTWRELDLLYAIALVVALWIARIVLSTPLRAAALAAGARELGVGFNPLVQTPALMLVWLLSSGLELLIVGGGLVLTLGPAHWFIVRGTWWAPVIIVVIGALIALLLSALCRVLFAYAAIEASAGRKGPTEALSLGFQHMSRDFLAVLVIVMLGEVLVGLGGLICGAGALPGTPYADLVLLHRWTHRTENT